MTVRLARAPLALLAALLALQRGADTASRDVLAVVAELLPATGSPDPSSRLEARRLIRLAVLDHYRRLCPEGMRFVPGKIVITAARVEMTGGFYLATHEVTRDEFRAFAASAGMELELPPPGDGRLPVTMVTLDDAQACAAWRGARLPTREELERAATAGGRARYPWGNRFDPRFCNSREGGAGAAEAAGSRGVGCTTEGVADLLGNVAEWSASSAGEGERRRFLAVGGSYLSPAKDANFVTYRLRAEARVVDVGFRLAKSLPPLELPGGDRGRP
jgi:hypothetical protein